MSHQKSTAAAALLALALLSPCLSSAAGIELPNLSYYPVDKRDGLSMSLNGTWKFHINKPEGDFTRAGYDDSAWKSIKVPGNWEMQGFENPGYGKKGLNESEGFYRTNFRVPATWAGQRTFLRFEGVGFGFELWVNGQRAGAFASSFNRSEFDITSFVKPGGSVDLAVRVTHRDKGWEFDTNDDWNLSGIFRDVVLFAVPDLHIADYTVTTPVADDGKTATVKVKTQVASFPGAKSGDGELAIDLLDPSSKVVKTVKQPVKISSDAAQTLDSEIAVASPQLWNAETPALYRLNLTLTASGKPLQQVTQRVGLRSTRIDNGVFKLNGKPVKFRGINHHDLHPETGRAMTREQYVDDIELMKKANINAVRMAHYPPQKVFLDLCDEYGLYVIDEVPFGFGEDHLTDESYRDVLALRAKATVARDKNQTSVMVWTVGNENPYTPLVVETAALVKQLDPSRSRSIAHPSGKYYFELPPEVDIVSPHYLSPRGSAENAGRGEDGGGGVGKDEQKGRFLEDVLTMPEVTAPVLMTEYCHAAGTSLENLKKSWEIMETSDRYIGGCLWMLQDQGLFRKVPAGSYPGRPKGTDLAPVAFGKVEANTWVAPDRVIDTGGAGGADGIVDADRKTTSDYYIVRKVYSTVVVPVDSLELKPGKQTLKFPIRNRYDFTNLSAVSGSWELMIDGQKAQSGKLDLNAAPRTEQTVELPVTLPAESAAHDAYVRLAFVDKDKRAIAEHTIRLGKSKSFKPALDALASGTIKQTTAGRTTTIAAGKSVLQVNEETGKVSFGNTGNPEQAFKGIALRVGRAPQMSELRAYPAKKMDFWTPYLLRNPQVRNVKIHPVAKGQAKVDLTLQFNREGTSTNPKTDISKQSVVADVHITLSDKGWLDIDYTLKAVDATDHFLETGLALEMPAASNKLTWLGEGIFPMVPVQDNGTDRGVYRISPKPDFDPANRWYPGNRIGVDLAAATDSSGNGLGVACDASAINLESDGDNTFLSQVLLSAGHGGKRAPSAVIVKAKDLNATGSMRVMPLATGQWPKVFKSVLANPETKPVQ